MPPLFIDCSAIAESVNDTRLEDTCLFRRFEKSLRFVASWVYTANGVFKTKFEKRVIMFLQLEEGFLVAVEPERIPFYNGRKAIGEKIDPLVMAWNKICVAPDGSLQRENLTRRRANILNTSNGHILETNHVSFL